MGKKVSAAKGGARPPNRPYDRETGSLYTARGVRKYLTRSERQRAVAVMSGKGTDAGLLALTIAFTGCRVSEALSLNRQSFDVEAGLVAIVTLKRRRLAVREVPIPRELMDALDRHFDLTTPLQGEDATPSRLWPCCRVTAWRHMKAVMAEAGVTGAAACPRGLRHGFGVHTLRSGVPLTLVQRWLGHERLTSTAVYTSVSGADERAFATDYWRWSGEECFDQAA